MSNNPYIELYFSPSGVFILLILNPHAVRWNIQVLLCLLNIFCTCFSTSVAVIVVEEHVTFYNLPFSITFLCSVLIFSPWYQDPYGGSARVSLSPTSSRGEHEHPYGRPCLLKKGLLSPQGCQSPLGAAPLRRGETHCSETLLAILVEFWLGKHHSLSPFQHAIASSMVSRDRLIGKEHSG